MARTRPARHVDQVLNIAKMLEKKTRELIPFSANMPAGDEVKKAILFLLNRKQLKAQIEQYSQINLDPSIITDPGEPVLLHDENDDLIETTLLDILDLVCSLDNRLNRHRKNGDVKSELECLETILKNFIKYGVGNCGELTDLLTLLLREYQPEDHISIQYESLCIEGRGDHVLVIINRNPESDIKDVASWGAQAIICDPWFRETVIVSDQLKLSKQARANCITYLLAYIDEPFAVYPLYKAGSEKPHSSYWYNKYGHHSSALFINRQGTIPFSAQFEVIDREYTALFYAVTSDHDDIVSKLLVEGGNPNHACDGNTLLTCAIKAGYVPIIKHLIAAGADPNLASHGEPPLVSAVIQNNPEIVQILMDAGADINQPTNNGHTALFIANNDNKREEIAQILLNAKKSSPRP